MTHQEQGNTGRVLFESRFIRTDDGLQIHYSECGHGPPVVFIHGSGNGASGRSNFEANMLAFAEAGFRAIALDLIGYGRSSKPTDRRYTLEFHVSALEELVLGLGLEKAHLVGNSLGGAIAMRYAMENPGRTGKLVLLAPGGLGPVTRYLRMPGIRAIMWSHLGPGGPSFARLKRVFRLQVHDPSIISDALIKERLDVAKTQPRQVYKTLKVDNLVPRLGEVKSETLAWWGTGDRFCPVETASVLADGIAGSRVVLVGRCGHWVQLEHADLFNRESIRFLKGGDDARAAKPVTSRIQSHVAGA